MRGAWGGQLMRRGRVPRSPPGRIRRPLVGRFPAGAEPDTGPTPRGWGPSSTPSTSPDFQNLLEPHSVPPCAGHQEKRFEEPTLP